jgi:hypothetical protein
MTASLALYGVLTGRRITPATSEWIADMVDRWGEDAVSRAMEREAQKGSLGRLLSRVQDRCAVEAIARLPGPAGNQPITLHRDELLAIARGQQLAPDAAFVWSASELTGEEYREVLASPLVRGSMPGRRS